MESLIRYLNTFGIQVDTTTPDIVMVCGYFLILSVFILLNIINIIIYLGSIYILSNENILNKIPTRYKYVHKIIKYYTNIRVLYIIIEFIFVLITLIIMISFTYGIVSFYIHMK